MHATFTLQQRGETSLLKSEDHHTILVTFSEGNACFRHQLGEQFTEAHLARRIYGSFDDAKGHLRS